MWLDLIRIQIIRFTVKKSCVPPRSTITNCVDTANILVLTLRYVIMYFVCITCIDKVWWWYPTRLQRFFIWTWFCRSWILWQIFIRSWIIWVSFLKLIVWSSWSRVWAIPICGCIDGRKAGNVWNGCIAVGCVCCHFHGCCTPIVSMVQWIGI